MITRCSFVILKCSINFWTYGKRWPWYDDLFWLSIILRKDTCSNERSQQQMQFVFQKAQIKLKTWIQNSFKRYKASFFSLYLSSCQYKGFVDDDDEDDEIADKLCYLLICVLSFLYCCCRLNNMCEVRLTSKWRVDCINVQCAVVWFGFNVVSYDYEP